MSQLAHSHPLERYLSLPARAVRRLARYRALLGQARGGLYGTYTEAERRSPDPNAARELRERCGLETYLDPELGGLVVRAGTTRFRLASANILYTLREVYADAVYRIDPSEDCTLLDIGANVGVSSLFLAGLPRVRAILAYEPFAPTYGQLLANLALNPHLAGKISARNEGVARAAATLTVDFCPTHTTIASVTDPAVHGSAEPVVRETVRLRAATEVAREALAAAGPLDLIAKIDCEGAEYEIVEAWEAAGLLGRFRALLLEWHRRGPEPLIAAFTRNGFLALQPGAHPSYCGMIYAIRTR